MLSTLHVHIAWDRSLNREFCGKDEGHRRVVMLASCLGIASNSFDHPPLATARSWQNTRAQCTASHVDYHTSSFRIRFDEHKTA